ncbi:unnamed protein product, partial [Mesorhabditis belari]|uniref:Uncharacterized protein n=1 Tax=Mesorhabditis belari TaxID=2138241 RepID=A0AAF3FDX2_9BILA
MQKSLFNLFIIVSIFGCMVEASIDNKSPGSSICPPDCTGIPPNCRCGPTFCPIGCSGIPPNCKCGPTFCPVGCTGIPPDCRCK